jgi:hypothetical protein
VKLVQGIDRWEEIDKMLLLLVLTKLDIIEAVSHNPLVPSTS